MILLTYKFIFYFLICKVNSIFLRGLRGSTSQYTEESYLNLNLKENLFLNRLYTSKEVPEVNSEDKINILEYQNQEVNNKNSHGEYMYEKDSPKKFLVPIQYSNDGEFQFQDKIKSEKFSSSSKKNECQHRKNDIAALFDQNVINISLETEFTKSLSSELFFSTFSSENSIVESAVTMQYMGGQPTEESTQDLTEPSSTTCSTIKQLVTPMFYKFTCGTNIQNACTAATIKKHKKQRKSTGKKKCTPTIINNTFQKVSRKAMVNMIVHVHCDHSKETTQIVPHVPIYTIPIANQNVYFTSNVITQPPYITYHGFTKTVDNQMIPPQFYSNQYSQMPKEQGILFQTKQSNYYSNELLDQQSTEYFDKPLPLSKIKQGTVTCEKNIPRLEMETGTKTKLSFPKNYQNKNPRPFLPQDIILKSKIYPPLVNVTPTNSNAKMVKAPLFLCQVTDGLSKASNAKTLQQKLTSSRHYLWKNFSFPHIKLKKTTTESNIKNVSSNSSCGQILENITVLSDRETKSPIIQLQPTSNNKENKNYIQEIIRGTIPQTNLQTTSFIGTESSYLSKNNKEGQQNCMENEEEDEEEVEDDVCENEVSLASSSTDKIQTNESPKKNDESEPWRFTKLTIGTFAMSNKKFPKEVMGTIGTNKFTLNTRGNEQNTSPSLSEIPTRGEEVTATESETDEKDIFTLTTPNTSGDEKKSTFLEKSSSAPFLGSSTSPEEGSVPISSDTSFIGTSSKSPTLSFLGESNVPSFLENTSMIASTEVNLYGNKSTYEIPTTGLFEEESSQSIETSATNENVKETKTTTIETVSTTQSDLSKTSESGNSDKSTLSLETPAKEIPDTSIGASPGLSVTSTINSEYSSSSISNAAKTESVTFINNSNTRTSTEVVEDTSIFTITKKNIITYLFESDRPLKERGGGKTPELKEIPSTNSITKETPETSLETSSKETSAQTDVTATSNISSEYSSSISNTTNTESITYTNNSDIRTSAEVVEDTSVVTVTKQNIVTNSLDTLQPSKEGEGGKTPEVMEIPSTNSITKETPEKSLETSSKETPIQTDLIVTSEISSEYSSSISNTTNTESVAYTNISNMRTSAKVVEDTSVVTVTKKNIVTNSLDTLQPSKEGEGGRTPEVIEIPSTNSLPLVSWSDKTTVRAIVTKSTDITMISRSLISEGTMETTFNTVNKEGKSTSSHTTYLTQVNRGNQSQSLLETSTKTNLKVSTDHKGENVVESRKITDVIDLGGNKYQFYFNNRWLITDKVNFWSYNDYMSTALNESFIRTSKENFLELTDKAKLIEYLSDKIGSFNFSTQIPFQLFAQSILLTSKYNHINNTLSWLGFNLTYEDIVGMLRYSDFDQFNSSRRFSEWNSVNWSNIYQIIKHSGKDRFANGSEYTVNTGNKTGTKIIVYSNGTSITANRRLILRDSLEILQSLNSYWSSVTSKVENIETTIAQHKEENIKYIIPLGGKNYQFYYKNRWYITDKQHAWLFDNSTDPTMDESYKKASHENIKENSLKSIEELLENIMKNGSNDFVEQVPFELFAQSVLKASPYDRVNRNLTWGNIFLKYSDIIGMLRLAELEAYNSSHTGYEQGAVSWENMYNRLKQSENTAFSDRYEYNIKEDGNKTGLMVAYFNGSSIWKNKTQDSKDTLNNLQNINTQTKFSERMINSMYVSKDMSFTSFVKNVFKQRQDAKTRYTTYEFKNKTLKYDELLALLALKNATLNDVSALGSSLQEIENSLSLLQNSKKHYFSDRTVYDIPDGSKLKELIVFANGTTEYDSRKLTFGEITRKFKELPSSDQPINISNDIQHTILLGGGKYQFYWRGKWYITDEKHVWPFDDETSRLMNETFFSITEDKTANKETIGKLMAKVITQSSQTQNEMPFELFSQNVLTARKYTAPNVVYKWRNKNLSYGDILAMIRLSKTHIHPMGYQTNWENLYEKVKAAAKTESQEKQEYTITDIDGSKRTITVYKNGTTIWRDVTFDVNETVKSVEDLNNESQFLENIINKPFEIFVSEVATREEKNISHSKYIWNNRTFTRYQVLAIHRMIMQEYFLIAPSKEKKSAKLSFSGITVPLLKAKIKYSMDKTVFNISDDSKSYLLTGYYNGTTIYYDLKLTLSETIKLLDQSRNDVGFIFKDDVEVLSNQKVPKETFLKDETERQHYYNWVELHLKPTLEVVYPISIGSGFVQFYFNSTWYVTDGITIWNFYGFNINLKPSMDLTEVVHHMNQTFSDDPRLSTTVIQELIDSKISSGSDDLLLPGVKMPFEVISQHMLFLSQKISKEYMYTFMNGFKYYYGKWILPPVDIIICIVLTTFDRSKIKSVEDISWNKTRKFNWEWLLHEVATKSEIIDYEVMFLYKFVAGAFVEYPEFIIYNNCTVAFDDKFISAHELYEQIELANKNLDTFVSEIKLTLDGDTMKQSFNKYGKQVMEYRLQNRIFLQYTWNHIKFDWYQFLAFLRITDLFEENTKDEKYWDNIISIFFKSNQEYFLEGFSVKIGNSSLTVYMNETTDFLGEMITDLEEYLLLFVSVS